MRARGGAGLATCCRDGAVMVGGKVWVGLTSRRKRTCPPALATDTTSPGRAALNCESACRSPSCKSPDAQGLR